MKRTHIFTGLALITGFSSSCLKDDTAIDPKKTNNVIEFINPSAIASPQGSVYALYTAAFEVADNISYPIEVSYSGAEVAPNDITVNLTTDPTAVDKYNTEQGKTYTTLPSTFYTLPTSVVIPKGQRRAKIALTIKTTGFDFSKSYALPLKIASASSGTISGNFSTILLSVNAKNKYDGIYDFKGFVLRQGDNVLSGFFKNYERTLATSNANSVTFAQLWANGGGVGGIDGLTLQVNETTNKVTVSSTTNAALKNATNYDSRYDPSTKTFYVSFFWGTGPTNRAATDTLTFKRKQ